MFTLIILNPYPFNTTYRLHYLLLQAHDSTTISMSIHYILIFIIGLVIITFSSDLVLKGATRIARGFGVSPLLIGLTVVSIGTSLPELAVGLTSIKEGSGDLAIGNIAGTNIVNILFILGLSALIRPLPLSFKNVKLDVVVMISSTLLLIIISMNSHLSNIEGLILLLLGVSYMIFLTRNAKKQEQPEEVKEEDTNTPTPSNWKNWATNIIYLVAGIAGTIYGAELLIESAIFMAKSFQVSDAVIGLTIVAIGTSLPELATTLVATIKGENRDVAIGNIIGSNINNILLILGATAFFSPNGIGVNDNILAFDLPLAGIVAIICYPIFKSGQIISRKEGIMMVSFYTIYVLTLLFMRA